MRCILFIFECCAKLRNSAKYKAVWKKAQVLDGSLKFAKAIKNFGFAMQRFDSLSNPLSKIFELLPEVFAFVCEISRVGDREDSKWACEVLAKISGPGSWQRIMVAALAADALLVLQRHLRMDDKGEGEVYIKAMEAGKKCMFCYLFS